MQRLSKVLVTFAATAVVTADVYLALQRLGSEGFQPIAWGMAAAALVLQVLAICALALYVVYLSRFPTRQDDTAGPIEVLRKRYWPFGVFIIVAVLSFDLLHNALLCGGASLPSVRGHALCPK